MATIGLQLDARTSRRLGAPALCLLTASLCAGCASPGPPKPPSLHLPALVKDLSAERAGDRVTLRWTTPAKTTDDLDVKGAMTAEICREAGARPLTPVARLTACAPVERVPVVPGPSEAQDTLPATLQTGPPVLLTYRIQIFNATGHSAGESLVAAYTASGPAPPVVASLRASTIKTGAVLEWRRPAEAEGASSATETVEVTRVDLSTPPAPAKKSHPAGGGRHKSAQPGKQAPPQLDEVVLRASDAGTSGETQGTVDATAKMGDTYTYVAERVRTVVLGSHPIEVRSAPSPTVTLAMHDTFPPKSPTGLATVPGTSSGQSGAGASINLSIDLSWEPNAEPDLAGYLVYRQLAMPDGTPQGPLARLTAVPIPAPAYRDVAVRPGQRYIYYVTAVDAAGNESAPSAKAQEVVDSPH